MTREDETFTRPGGRVRVPHHWHLNTSESASNPTSTIFATALRGAEHLAEKWGSVAG